MGAAERLERYAGAVRYAVQDRGVTGWRYTLTADVPYPVPEAMALPGVFENRWLRLGPREVVVKRPYSSDGCTLVPDFSRFATFSRCAHEIARGNVAAGLALCGPYVAHWPHDALYQFAVEIGRAFGWSRYRVVRWANAYFGLVMAECGTPRWQRWLYRIGVGVFGQAFAAGGRALRALGRLVGALVVLSVAGASCALWGPSGAGNGGLEPEAPVPARTNVLRRAVCVGLNHVDPAKWEGWYGGLKDCEYDAELWHETWRDLGFESTNLLTAAATVENCRRALEWAVDGMQAGDLLVVEVSGHGGQWRDTEGEGRDRLGEYLCLYDGPLSDNTVNRWLRSVPAGVRILWGADTCHSGDLFKAPVRFRRAAIPAGFRGELILLAGCSEDGRSLSTGEGGLWSNARRATGPEGMTPVGWFRAAKARVPSDKQVPVYAEYGRVSEAFRNLELAPGGGGGGGTRDEGRGARDR